MSVLFETSLGDIIVDLETTLCPTLSLNFLKLCKSYYYNFNSFHHVIPEFIAQTGDPTDSGTGGSSIWNQLSPTSKDYQKDPFFVPPGRELSTTTRLRHSEVGTLSMAMAQLPSSGKPGEGERGGGIGSQFFFTLGQSLDYLDGKHVPFGRVVEGLETLGKVGESLLDQQGRPLRDIRIRHVIVLDDPFPDPEGLSVPPDSPVPTAAQLASLRVGEDEELVTDEDPELVEQRRREHEAKAQALTLEMVGDLPFADVAPPENVLFVCKLNQVTTSEDLELIFSRFGEILSCEIIKDQKTGDSLQYAFIEFKERDSAEKAYVKMDNVLVDDRRIHVDFSQSVSKLHNSWVFNKTGGRPPPNKHDDRGGGGGGGGRRGSSNRSNPAPLSSSHSNRGSNRDSHPPSYRRGRDDDSNDYDYGGGGGTRDDRGLLFDMREVDESRRMNSSNSSRSRRGDDSRRDHRGEGRSDHYGYGYGNNGRRRGDERNSLSPPRGGVSQREPGRRDGGGGRHRDRDSYRSDRDRDRDRGDRYGGGGDRRR